MTEEVSPEEYEGTEIPTLSPAEVVKLTKFLVEDKTIPRQLAEKSWAFSNKESVLTNLNENQINQSMLKFDIAENYKRMAKQDYDNTWDVISDKENHRVDWFLRLNRAKQGFERKMQTTQIRQFHSTRGSGNSKSIGQRVMGGLGGLFGGKK